MVMDILVLCKRLLDIDYLIKRYIKLINAVNGNIRNTKRLVQFNKVCILLNIDFKEPIKLTKDNSLICWIFDADGTINYYLKIIILN
ncbi:Intron-encoded RNA maturase bI4 [Saccharomyces cerevisiae]|nr:Intron-encoded RNA maturase bI4 [Saccharomyces cerevisiae]